MDREAPIKKFEGILGPEGVISGREQSSRLRNPWGGTSADLGFDGKVAPATASRSGRGRAGAFTRAAEGARIMVSRRDESAL